MAIIKMFTGDASHDGHGLHRSTLHNVSCSYAELKEFYIKGTEIIGFDLTRDVSTDFEDSHIQGKSLQLLIKAGYPVDELEDYYEGDDEEEQSAYLNHDSFVHIYFFIVELGAGDHIFSQEVILHDTAKHDIGGYGLYSF